MKKIIFVFLLSVLGILGAPDKARAVAINLSYALNYYPPNPCAGSVLSGLMGVYDLALDGMPLIPNPGPQETPSGHSTFGSFIFNADPGALLYLSFEGATHCPEPGPPDAPVFAFAAGTREGDPDVAGLPLSAPLIFIGEVDADGFLLPNPGPPDLPLFAFSSPGIKVGFLSVALAPVPEPSTILLLGGGVGGLVLLRRLRKG